MSWTAREDAAEAAGVILASKGDYDGPVTLTVKAAPTFTEIAGVTSELTGRTIETEVVPADEWVATRVAAGQPEFMARFTLGMYQAASEGFFAGVEPCAARK